MHCYAEAAAYYDVPAIILRAIHHVEGGKKGDRVPDPNGTFDHGFMQINTCWKPLLHEQGWTMRFITHHDCANIFAAAWILKQYLDSTGNLWLSVADYHSGDPVYGYPYAKMVYQQALTLEKYQPKSEQTVDFVSHVEIKKSDNVTAPQNMRFQP